MRNTIIKLHSTILLAAIMLLINLSRLPAQRQMEVLDRGLLAVKIPGGVFISWRVLGTEWKDVSYNLYRDSIKLNSTPISGATCFIDESGTLESFYFIRSVTGELEQDISDTVGVWEKSYFDLPVRPLPGGYQLNDASVGDLDGDGDYEIVVKRISPDMSEHPVFTHLLEAYHLDGSYLWTIDYGPNQMGPQQVNFIVYDLDGDGKAEVVTKTSEGTIDGTGTAIGDTDEDGIINYRFSATQDDITQGPEFLSIYEGATGKELVRTNYITRDPLSQWGLPGHDLTQLAHRADAVMMAIIYADGKTPTLIMCRGIYHRIKMVAMNYRDGQLSTLWHFDSNEWPAGFGGQGNHNLSVADVDNDGRDEIVYGAMTVDHDGTGLYTTNLGHGDAMHVSDMDPYRPGLEVWQAHEGGPHYGGTYRDAATGEVLIQYFGNRDMGRACAGDITAAWPGYELWGATECPVYNCRGSTLGPTNIPVNFMIWWDGDLLRELLDHTWLGSDAGVGIGTISKYTSGDDVLLLSANGTYSTNYTKGNPCLSADILGDWREEVIWRTTDDNYLRIYTTTFPTQYRIYTLMHDPQYRLAIAWQPNGYNQPPHPGFFLGDGMDSLPPPPLAMNKLVWNSGQTWDINNTSAWIKDDIESVFNNGDHVLFDLTPGEQDSVILSGSLAPSSITVFAPTGYTFTGTGSIIGSACLDKAGSGVLHLQTMNDYTGPTVIWDGSLILNGSLASHVSVKKFAVAAGSGNYKEGVTLESLSNLVIGGEYSADTMRIGKILRIMADATLCFDLSGDSAGNTQNNDLVIIDGNLETNGKINIMINQLDDSLQWGSYTLISFSGSFTGELDEVTVTGVPGIPWELAATDNAITIRFIRTRAPGTLVWKGGEPADWDLVTSMNWLKNGVADWFVSRDTVCFTDLGILYNEVNLQGNLFTGLVKIEAEGDYVFNGPGSITGTGGLVKKKSGKLIIRNNNDYTGATLINEGIIEVERLGNSGEPGPLGSGTSNPYNLLLDGGTLRITGSSASDRDIGLGQGNGVVDITGTELRLNGIFYGEGQLIKTGSGTLTCTMANTHQLGTLIEEGRVYLGTETANISGPGPGPVTILNGRLSMLDDRNSYTDSCDWHLVIPQGGKARLELDSRCSLTGTLTGSGILDLSIPFIRSELFGDWSSFTGKINAFTSSSSASFIAGNVTGLPGADIQLDDNILLLYRHTASDTIPLGSLSGTAASRLGAGGEGNAVITWRIGTNNSNAQFSGIICNDQFKNEGAVASIIKSGTGAWTLTGSNTYSGNTTLEKGTLWIRNRTGSGTGYGPVTVLGGATLGGNGRVSGPVIIEQNGILFPGPLPGSVFISDSTVLVKNGGMLAFEVDPLNKSSALLRVISKLTMNGYIYFTNSGSLRLAAGDVFTLADAGQIDGQPEGIIPLSPGEGLQWDVSEWKNKGIIKVKLATGDRKIFSPPSFLIYPNPAVESLNILLAEEDPDTRICIENLHGQKIMEIKTNNQLYLNLRIEHLAPGMYFVKRLNGRSVIARKFIKK